MKPNAKQQEAIEYLDGPLLVLAGPGTGKTQLLSEKVAYILEKNWHCTWKYFVFNIYRQRHA